MNYEAALELLHTYTKGESLRKHAYAVEASMRAYAKKFGQDETKWAITGLLHDFDYEQYPALEEHTVVGAKILREHGYPEDVIYAIMAHNHVNHLERHDLLSKALFACDELSGFVMAATLVRPSKNIADLEVQSVKKKLKDKAFARGVSREDIHQGATELELNLDDHISFVIEALREVSGKLGLDGGHVA